MFVLKITFITIVLFHLPFTSCSNALEEWEGWVSGRYMRAGPGYRNYDSRVITVNIFGKDYIFKRTGKKHYTTYDFETGNIMEMKIRKNGQGIIYDFESGDDIYVILPEASE
jgi:hypothetical protein